MQMYRVVPQTKDGVQLYTLQPCRLRDFLSAYRNLKKVDDTVVKRKSYNSSGDVDNDTLNKHVVMLFENCVSKG